MNNEEKKAIEYWKYIKDTQIYDGYKGQVYAVALLNLIEKQQKEIEDLKENNTAISKASYMAGVLDERSQWYKKINEKIEDLQHNNNGDDYSLINVINIIKELIGKEE
jgi:lipid II:glycine glycyltransferase (peptidoglycan interpeptide bridge formation enzyme)